MLKRSAEFIGGSAASIYSKSSATGVGTVYHQFGVEPYYQHLYFSKYIRLDPTTAGHCLADVGQLISLGDIMPYREFEESRLHQEWAAPQSLVDCLSTPLDKSARPCSAYFVTKTTVWSTTRRAGAGPQLLRIFAGPC